MGPLGLNAPVVIGDGARGALVAWEDFRDGDRTNIYLQRVAADGSIAPGWPVNGLGVGIAANDQYAPHVARDGAGGAIVTWADATESARHRGDARASVAHRAAAEAAQRLKSGRDTSAWCGRCHKQAWERWMHNVE